MIFSVKKKLKSFIVNIIQTKHNIEKDTFLLVSISRQNLSAAALITETVTQ